MSEWDRWYKLNSTGISEEVRDAMNTLRDIDIMTVKHPMNTIQRIFINLFIAYLTQSTL